MSLHGGPDAFGAPAHDFSTNANACGPCPAALAAVRAANPSRYPDPACTALRERLAAFHGVAVGRIVPAASASEFIGRISTLAAAAGAAAVVVPALAYGDYAQAAQARGLAVRRHGVDPDDGIPMRLAWACDPATPTGQAEDGLVARLAACDTNAFFVLDRAYEPLRLAGALALAPSQLDRVWQLWSPNKALGLTGVRGAYAIAPRDSAAEVIARLQALAPSWPLGAHAMAMLRAWTEPTVQQWMADSRGVLAVWKTRQQAMCDAMGWAVLPSVANFFCARCPDAAALLVRLREQDIKLRDGGSFGLPGHLRLGVLPPASQEALAHAWAMD